VNWGYQPNDFWKCSPTHFWWIAEAKNEVLENQPTHIGGMTQKEVDRLYQKIQEPK
jgi:hypothetical protein